MLNLSKYFKQDIIDTNQTLKPILVITEPSDESVLFTLTQDKDDILDADDPNIAAISRENAKRYSKLKQRLARIYES